MYYRSLKPSGRNRHGAALACLAMVLRQLAAHVHAATASASVRSGRPHGRGLSPALSAWAAGASPPRFSIRCARGRTPGGLSRKAILREIDHSLRRLRTDHVDLYQIHRWDYRTPIEETLEALTEVVRAGKARYIGASSMYAWQFAKALHSADRHGWTRFVTMQDHYNLLHREEEREMLPLCQAEGVGVLPWSPLARGRLTRDWDQSSPRSETDLVGKALYAETTAAADRRIVERAAAIAAERGVPRAQLALAWLLQKPVVTAPIVGASKPGHLADAVAALSPQLSTGEIAALEELYIPHLVVGFA